MANKTQPTDVDPAAYVAGIKNPRKRQDATVLMGLFQDATGFQPMMWGETIVGFGSYHYQYETGRKGDFLATGFAARAARFSIYIMPGYQDYSALLARLGKHRVGKSCLYINKLADIDQSVLRLLIKTGLSDLNKIWKVQAG